MNDYDQSQPRDAFFTKRIRAGKRTYYFDVKATRGNDYYITITESKRKPGESDDQPFFEKHKLFLYKEDFEKFSEGLQDSLNYIRERRTNEGTFVKESTHYGIESNNGEENLQPDSDFKMDTVNNQQVYQEPMKSSFSDIDFDDLNK
jgi:hypothetical protein